MNCEKITYLIEKGQLKDLKVSEKLRIKLHKYMCKCCSNYEQDSKVLHNLLKLLDKQIPDEQLTQSEKDEIKRAIRAL